MVSPIPESEAARLAALHQYGLLDTDPERSYDDLTALAAFICHVPISIMVLLDSHRQWFKSKLGLNATETPREHGFCAHAILSNHTLVVEDASKDSRFSGNTLVLADPFIRFYAGAPLINSEGHALGTLCVVDSKPRQLTSEQLGALEALARQVVALMELRRVASELSSALNGLRELRDLLPICAWCKNIRNDKGYWGNVEDYLRLHTGTATTHGICPDCFTKQIAN